MQIIKSLFGLKSRRKIETDFSEFFHNASSSEKKKVFKAVIREANQDQQDLIKNYNSMHRT